MSESSIDRLLEDATPESPEQPKWNDAPNRRPLMARCSQTDIALHVAEILAVDGLRGTLRELALSSRAHFHAVLPALYREIDFVELFWKGIRPAQQRVHLSE